MNTRSFTLNLLKAVLVLILVVMFTRGLSRFVVVHYLDLPKKGILAYKTVGKSPDGESCTMFPGEVVILHQELRLKSGYGLDPDLGEDPLYMIQWLTSEEQACEKFAPSHFGGETKTFWRMPLQLKNCWVFFKCLDEPKK